MELTKEHFDKQLANLDQKFVGIDKQFQALRTDMDKRFNVMDRKFEGRFEGIDKRFDAMDKKFVGLFTKLDLKIDKVQADLGAEIAQIQTRMVHKTDLIEIHRKLDTIDKRTDEDVRAFGKDIVKLTRLFKHLNARVAKIERVHTKEKVA